MIGYKREKKYWREPIWCTPVICNLSTQEAKSKDSQIQGQPGLYSKITSQNKQTKQIATTKKLKKN
jgi:hypothetical protein